MGTRLKQTCFAAAFLNLVMVLPCYAQWWNPLGPGNFNDCVLQGMKGVSSDDAARAIQYACAKKYPPEKSMEETSKEALLKKCGLSPRHWEKHMFFRVDGRHSLIATPIVEKINVLNFGGDALRVQNKNAFGISGVRLGFTKERNCPTKPVDFAAEIYCSKGDTKAGIAANAIGNFQCDPTPREVRVFGYCVTAFSPSYNQFGDDLPNFMNKRGMCER
jgi:hypothetical protein